MKTRVRPAQVGRLKHSDAHRRILGGVTIPGALEAIPVLIGVKHRLVRGITAREDWFRMTRRIFERLTDSRERFDSDRAILRMPQFAI